MASKGPLTFDSVLDLCRHRYRRIVLGTLVEDRRSVTIDDLTEVVLKYNHDTTIAAASENVRTDIRLSLHHVHLPKLASGGLITYDPERQFVEPTAQLDQVQSTLSTVLGAEPTLEPVLER
ncbi:DUF7344 domain-containing protein [Haloarcula marina]|uniref:DUF7344 domain-containing protein n=1 Tax=Haloarcula marina TaxID=2961574 RepID=UPI0020B8BD3E|nr:hypothetical protein [Halomicroarcula marina]